MTTMSDDYGPSVGIAYFPHLGFEVVGFYEDDGEEYFVENVYLTEDEASEYIARYHEVGLTLREF